jgi:ring-1,2-phenylacetyl-CoA epoxidase subunit PaaD
MIAPRLADAWSALASVPDPEIPVVSIVDLGIVRALARDGDTLGGDRHADLLGLPRDRAHRGVDPRGPRARRLPDARVDIALSPPWSTDWIADDAKKRLRDFGIAPPARRSAEPSIVDVRGLSPLRRASTVVPCPRCGSAAHAGDRAVRLDRVQGALPLRRLPRAVRLLQAALAGPECRASTACRSRASTARPATRSR